MMSPQRSCRLRFSATLSRISSAGLVSAAMRVAKLTTPASSSISALSSRAMAALVPNALYTVASATPASAAIASTVVPAYPEATKSRRAAPTICRRVPAACCCRHVAMLLTVPVHLVESDST